MFLPEPILPRTEDGNGPLAYILTKHPLRDGSHGFEEIVRIDAMDHREVLVLVPEPHPKAGFVLVDRSDIVDFFTTNDADADFEEEE